MKIRHLIILIIFLFVNIAIAQEDIELIPSEERLEVRYHTFGGQYTIDLKKYLGNGPYIVYETKNVIIDINQNTGKAIIAPKEGFQGSEIIKFALNKTKSVITLPKETLKEINLGRTIIFNDIFDNVIDDIKKEDIKSLEAGFRGNKVAININDEVNLLVGYDEDLKPEFSFDILLANKGAEVRYGIFDRINLKFIAVIISIILFIYFFRDKLISIIRTKEDKSKIKKIFLAKLSRYKENDEKIIELTEEFFERFLKIKKGSGLYLLDLALEKRQIKGDLKQEIIDLFRHLSNDEHDSKEISHIYGTLRRILVKL